MTRLTYSWTQSIRNHQEKLGQNLNDDSLITKFYFFARLIKICQAPLAIFNITCQCAYLSDYLNASNSQSLSISSVQILLTLFAMTELLLLAYSTFTLRSIFKLSTHPQSRLSSVIEASNHILLASSIVLLYNIKSISDSNSYSRLDSLFPTWNLNGIFILGLATLVLTLPIWIIIIIINLT